MTIKTYLEHLEKIKQDLLALALPENTKLVNPPDMGSMIDFNDCGMRFTPKEAFIHNDRRYAYEYLCGLKLTKKEEVVIVHCYYNAI